MAQNETPVRDPVCGMDVMPSQAAAQSIHDGETFYFCARTCKARFDKDPERYVHAADQRAAYARALHESLGTLSKAFYGPLGQMDQPWDLTDVEWEVLRLLQRHGECRMRELAQGCGVALSTMTGVVDRLLKKGLVQRRHSAADRRVVLVRLSGKGKLAYEARLDADMRLVLSMLQALAPREQRTLVSLLQKIVASLPQDPAS